MGVALEAASVSVGVQPHFCDSAIAHQLPQILLACLECNVAHICYIIACHLHSYGRISSGACLGNHERIHFHVFSIHCRMHSQSQTWNYSIESQASYCEAILDGRSTSCIPCMLTELCMSACRLSCCQAAALQGHYQRLRNLSGMQ